MAANPYLSGKLRQNREKAPVVNVYLHSNPSRVFSVTVPESKQWQDFMNKIKSQFELPENGQIKLEIETSTKDEYLRVNTTTESDMSRVRHKTVFRASTEAEELKNEVENERKSEEEEQIEASNEEIGDNEEDSKDENENEGEEDEEDEEEEEEVIAEEAAGVRVNIFGRLFRRNKSKQIPMYQYPPGLPFDPKKIWNERMFQCSSGVYLRKDTTENPSNYSFIGDKNDEKVSIKTLKMIWPLKYQKLTEENEKVPIEMEQVCKEMVWCIILCHGGKFAGAIYKNDVMIAHKTFHRYVKRCKQGKRQANFVGGSHPRKSAGGQKRNLNESKLRSEIQSLLTSWQEYLQNECTSIFLHCPGPVNSSTLFGMSEEQMYLYPEHGDGSLNQRLSNERLKQISAKSKSRMSATSKKGNQTDAQWKGKGNEYRLWKKNPIIYKINITTKRVTLSEIERVHRYLSTGWMRADDLNK